MDIARLAALLDRAAAGEAVATAELLGSDLARSTARAMGGDLGFRFAWVELNALLGRAGELTDDTVRERYSALVEEHGADTGRLALLRPLGERIRQLEHDGVLPRSMVMRSRRRRD